MRIGLIIYGSLETLSGGYLYDRQLVQRLRDYGDQVEILSIPWRNYPRHLGDNLNAGLFRSLKRFAGSCDLLLQDELNHPSLFLLNARLRRQTRAPLICVVHHLRCGEDHGRLLRHLYRWVERRYLQSIDGCIYNSSTTRDSVARLLDKPLPGTVAYPAADHLITEVDNSINRYHRESMIQESTLRLLFVGNVIPRKGVEQLLRSLSLLRNVNVHLDIVGSLQVDTRYVARIEALIEELNLVDVVQLSGQLSDTELRERYRQSHLLVVPSFEGFGIVYLEAMGAGLPVIASTHGAAREIVIHGKNGFLVAPSDVEAIAHHVRELHADRSKLQQMSRHAYRFFRQHPTWAESMDGARNWMLEFMTHDTLR